MSKVCKISSCLIAGLLIAAGIVLLAGDYPQKLIDSEMKKELVISMDSPVFDDWVNPPPPIYMQYWLFNVTNPKDVINGSKANLTQVGPYTYRLYQPRFNVIFYQNNTVSYQYNHTLVFVRDMSIGDDDKDQITTLNVPLVTIGTMLKNIVLPSFLKGLIREFIKIVGDSDLFIQRTPKQLLFGYNDKLLTLAHDAFGLIGKNFSSEFGAFYGFNNTDDGVYLIDSGRGNISNVNNIERWNYETHLNYWSNQYGNMINGTDGVFYYPGLKETDSIAAYSTDICRSLPFAYEKRTSVRGLHTYRFSTTEMAFANTTVNPNNDAFCVPPGNCLDSGVLNISVCKQDAPVIISSPHFYQGAQKYIHGVNGLNPQKSEHETCLDIEPETGTVLSANKRLQVNIYLEKSPFSTQMTKVRTTVFPFLWLNESVYIDHNSASRLKGVFTLKGFVLSVPYILFAVAALMFLIVLILVFRQRKNGNYSVMINDHDEYHEPVASKETE